MECLIVWLQAVTPEEQTLLRPVQGQVKIDAWL